MSTPIWISPADTAWTTAANWSTGNVPVSTDDAVLTNNAINIASGLAQSAVTLASLTVSQSMTGLVGTSTTYLAIGATVVTLGTAAKAGETTGGSRRLNLNFGATAISATILATGAAGIDTGFSPLRVLGTNLTLKLIGGRLGIAEGSGETATVASLTIQKGGTVTPVVTLGPGVTLTSLTQSLGTVTNLSTVSVGTVVLYGGTYTVNGTATHTALTVYAAGKAVFNQACTITDATIYGEIDLSQGSGTVTFTNLVTFYSGGRLNDPLGRAVFTAGFRVVNGSLLNAKLNLGPNRSYTVT